MQCIHNQNWFFVDVLPSIKMGPPEPTSAAYRLPLVLAHSPLQIRKKLTRRRCSEPNNTLEEILLLASCRHTFAIIKQIPKLTKIFSASMYGTNNNRIDCRGNREIRRTLDRLCGCLGNYIALLKAIITSTKGN